MLRTYANLRRVAVVDVLRARVQQCLTARHQKPADLAKALGRKSSWATNFLKGRNGVPLATVDLIADALEVEASSLFDAAMTLAVTPAAQTRDDVTARPSTEAQRSMLTPAQMELVKLAEAVKPEDATDAYDLLADYIAVRRRRLHEGTSTEGSS